MSQRIFGYSDFLTVLEYEASLLEGVIVDTNVLISATYDSDAFFDSTTEFLDLLVENEIPLFCNVSVRNEFLEIHRRIIFTEALIDFFHEVDRSQLPGTITTQLGKWAKNNEKRKNENKPPLRLSEFEIKEIKFKLMDITDGKKDLWSTLCEDRIGNKLESVWNKAEGELGLNFLTTRNEDPASLLDTSPEWSDTVKLIERYGLSSSDSMIVNIFACSKLLAMVTSDREVAHTVQQISKEDKICFVPDSLLSR